MNLEAIEKRCEAATPGPWEWEEAEAEKAGKERHDVIRVEGYKAFHGTMRITPVASSGVAPFELTGDWLYRPDTGCWYGCGRSFPAEICVVEEEN